MRHSFVWLLTAGILSLSVLPASAEPSDMTRDLCEDATEACQIVLGQDRASAREAVEHPVQISGNAGARVQAALFLAKFNDDGSLSALEKVGESQEALTGSGTATQVQLPVPATDQDRTGGWALLTVADFEGTDVTDAIGQWLPFGTSQVEILGDGYGNEKPIGKELELQYWGGFAGIQRKVQYLSLHGWVDLNTRSNETGGSPEEVSSVHYEIPSELLDLETDFRLTNAAAPVSWRATPTADGIVEERGRTHTPPPLGEDSTPTLDAEFPMRPLKSAAAALAAIALGVVLIGTPLANRRARHA